MLHVIILAAGQGKRMKSVRPKVLHEIGGQPLAAHVLAAARALRPARLHVVYGHAGEQVQVALAAPDVSFVHQPQQQGTGHAVSLALPQVPDEAVALVLYGDVPLIQPETLSGLLQQQARHGCALLSVRLCDPAGYGRILRDADGRVRGIVEHRDASEVQRAIEEVNTGVLAARAADLRRWLSHLRPHNAQAELYLTDVIALAVAEGVRVAAVEAGSVEEVMGVNDRVQLAQAERALMRRRAEALMRAGVTVRDPARLELRGEADVAMDAELDINVVLEGRVSIGAGAHIGPGVLLRDAAVGAGAQILAYSVIEGAEIGAGARIGPFARLRPGTRIAEGAHVGNFVEIKNSQLGPNAKANHLAYVGDASVGAEANIGAGVITCNYDGAHKHRTEIGDGAFVGSNAALVAPVKIGNGATIGAGSVVTKDAPEGELTLSRAPQRTLPGWKRPRK
jgi:bifunctional UDP-N-acetylglucosamine pyrophosphorylase/glucosamine-1-phosphate N-acetyltransferase